MGYNQKPLPCAALFEVKYVGEILDKYKVRIVGLGHAGNITPVYLTLELVGAASFL